MNLTDKECDAVIYALDNLARTCDCHELGLPMDNKEQMRRVIRESLKTARDADKFFWNCKTHGKSQNAWGCPECVSELRSILRIYDHAHTTGNSLPSSITAQARGAMHNK